MDYIDFINSRDIREHLRQINYVPSAAEAAFFVANSIYTTMDDRHRAFIKIADTYPNEHFPFCDKRLCNMPASEFLRKYVAYEKSFIREIKSGDGVYKFAYLDKKDDGHWTRHSYINQRIFSTYAACLTYIRQEFESESAELEKIEITKRYFDSEREISLQMLPDETPVAVELSGGDEGERMITDAFFDMWINVPTPFKRGDILRRINVCQNNFCIWNEVFVLTDMSTWNSKKLKENGYNDGDSFKRDAINFRHRDKWICRKSKGGDTSDMWICGYSLSEDEAIYSGTDYFTYLDAEYYREELDGKMRMFKVLSEYEKGNIDLCLLLRAYQKIYAEEKAEMEQVVLDGFIPELLQSIGLERKKSK